MPALLEYLAGGKPPNAQTRSRRAADSSSSISPSSTSSLAMGASSKGPKTSNPAKDAKTSKPTKPASFDKPSKIVKPPSVPSPAANIIRVSKPLEQEDDCSANGDPNKAEAKSVWHAIRRYDDNKENLILAVIKPEQVGPLKERVQKRGGALHSKLVVTTPGHLQRKIDAYVTPNCRKLYLLASTTVCAITYHISDVVKDVSVYPCGGGLTGQPDMLSIRGDSTYCGIRAYQWDQLPQTALPRARQITYGKGCSIDMQNYQDEAMEFIRSQPSTASTMSAEQIAGVREQFQRLQDELAAGPPAGQRSNAGPVSAGAAAAAASPAAAASHADDTESWFQRWKLLVAGLVGAGAAGGLGGGFMWFSAGGIFVKGPLGLSLSAGYFSVAAGGGVCLAAGGAGIAAGALFYFVPWGRVFDYVKGKLWQIWEYICDIVARIWQKIKSLASAAMSKVFFPCASQGPKPARFSA